MDEGLVRRKLFAAITSQLSVIYRVVNETEPKRENDNHCRGTRQNVEIVMW